MRSSIFAILDWEVGRTEKKKKSFALVFSLFSVLLAQLPELLPPVSAVETPHVAVHILFHSGIEASIRLASTAQAFGNIFFSNATRFCLALEPLSV